MKTVFFGKQLRKLFFSVALLFFLNPVTIVVATIVTENGLSQGDQTHADQAFHDGLKAYVDSNYLLAYKTWKIAEKSDHDKASFNLGRMWLLGQVPGKSSNQSQALGYFKKSANLGYQPAIKMLQSLEKNPRFELAGKSTLKIENEENVASSGLEESSLSEDKARQVKNKWLNHYSDNAWVIQIFASQDADLLKQMIRDFSLKDQANILSETVKGQTWYKLIYGQFTTKNQASQAKESLPERLRNEKPWVRAISSIKNAQKR